MRLVSHEGRTNMGLLDKASEALHGATEKVAGMVPDGLKDKVEGLGAKVEGMIPGHHEAAADAPAADAAPVEAPASTETPA